MIAAALAAGDELRLELHPAAVTAAGRSLVAGLVDCLPHRDAAGADSIAARLWDGLCAPPGARAGRGRRRRPGPAGRPRAGGVDGGGQGGRVGPGRPVRGGVGRAGHGQRDPARGASLGIEALLGEIDRPADAAGVVGARLRRGERLRGFGHRLYPDGDPRAGVLLAHLRRAAAGSPRLEVVEAVLATTARRGLPAPNVDFALAAVAHVTGLTRGAGEAIFAVARTAGWIAHALEEYDRNTPIRPRALYTGPAPGS